MSDVEQTVNKADEERKVGGFITYWNSSKGGVMWKKEKGETPDEIHELGVFSKRDLAQAAMAQYLAKQEEKKKAK